MRSAVAPRSTRSPISIQGAGVGLRLPHLIEVATALPSVSWLEAHPENFLANPHARELLLTISSRYPISLHSVGISVGSADGIDSAHLRRIVDLVAEIEPAFVSGHLAWSTFGGRYLNDLLPLPYDEEALEIVERHVNQVQDAIRQPFIVENPASYLAFGASTLSEIQFLGELTRRTGCQLLCDVSNIVVSASNLGYDPYTYIDEFPAEAVMELHLGGFTREAEDSDSEVLIDTHDSPIADEAWQLYAHALRRFGPKPTLIEWDSSLPGLATLIEEAAHASIIAGRVATESAIHAAVS
jgi:uncharacterized protein (UPF0276 family)